MKHMVLMLELANISTMHEEQKLKYPNMDSELESRVRKLLQRCSDMKDSSLVIGKLKKSKFAKISVCISLIKK